MTIDEAVRAIGQEPLPQLPKRTGSHSPAEYLSFISSIAQDTMRRTWEQKSDAGASEAIRQIGALAVDGMERNGTALGLRLVDRDWIFEAAAPNPEHSIHRSLTEFLLDIEGIVVKYKAHRPQLRTPEAAPKVAAILVEIISLAVAATQQHGSDV
jgi:hypothetical protein